MNKKTIKYLICLLVVLIIIFVGCFGIFYVVIEDGIKGYNMQNASFKEKVRLYTDIDDCLDFGICKEGLTVKVEGRAIIVNQESCIENKGQWRNSYCKFRYDYEREN